MPKPIYSEIDLPKIVREANALANQLNFPIMPEGRPVGYQDPPSACIPQVGRLLQVLASGKPGGRIGELRTNLTIFFLWMLCREAILCHRNGT